MKKRTCYPLLALALVLLPGIAAARLSGGEACAAQSPAAAEAIKRRVSVALYYELKLAMVSGSVYEWRANARPRKVASDARHVAVSASHGHLIDESNRVLRWTAGSGGIESVLENVAYVATGESGMLAIRCDGSLWQRKASACDWMRVADAAIHAWVTARLALKEVARSFGHSQHPSLYRQRRKPRHFSSRQPAPRLVGRGAMQEHL